MLYSELAKEFLGIMLENADAARLRAGLGNFLKAYDDTLDPAWQLAATIHEQLKPNQSPKAPKPDPPADCRKQDNAPAMGWASIGRLPPK